MLQYNACKEVISEISIHINNGAVVVLPTATNYNVFTRYDNKEGVKRIYKAKHRDHRKPLTLCCANVKMALQYVKIGSVSEALIKKCLPGNISFICRKNNKVPNYITSGIDTVAIANQSQDLLNAIIESVGAPLAGTSANLSGGGNVREYEKAYNDLGGKVDVMVNDGTLISQDANSIIDLLGNVPLLVREGDVDKATLKKMLAEIDDSITEAHYKSVTNEKSESSGHELLELD
ncbi:L-threonylcarbamoyladenylate synthase [Dasania sp. GY-MA-18]|uniref:L-threonylcarbamoyladenylate synthase n=1 Tax=Dasania phycosphaerae TaxID=2950436 RepID=A0A9J6RN40_9GAMM|nr:MULTISPECIES: L-threonylcarbamoyladenylate synthase [Dasania]MCR8923475.1 L-threonylcarbamoyladenylate synthase [Dasania sp. GY-MA-18]MCZ0865908.1 L-threonylcarbamoyladenylate synthase [Dasania phycosphaerae]MCZ0869633.1 L-threonylcarbamoyladenylate synthase [Dasania phycosphaerae]